MKKLILLLTILLLSNCSFMDEKYEWGAGISTEIGFPVRIYAGRVGDVSIMASFTASFDRPDDGWGVGTQEGSMMKQLPKDIDIIWYSYVEDCFYRVKADLDYPKLLKLFREGYKERANNLETFPKGYLERTFTTFVVGLAPGGVVVVWVEGMRRQIEIGRFQAEKINLKQPEGLDDHDALIFSEQERKETLEDERFRPKHIREKPTPFGLWDDYRDIKYPWYPTFEFYKGAKIGDVFIEYFNREMWDTFYEEMTLETPARKNYSSNEITIIPDIFYQKGEDISDKKYPLPSSISFGYRANNGSKYGGYYKFDWEENKKVFAEFFKMYPNTKRARLNIRLNKDNSLFTIRLENEKGDGVFFPFHRERLNFIKENDNETSIP